MATCTYFSLWDSDAGNLTEHWGSRLKELFEEEFDSNERAQIEMGIAPFDELKEDLLERESIDASSLENNKKIELMKANRTRERLDLPGSCPHQAVEGEDWCAFHLEPEKCREKGLSAEDVCERFLNKVRGDTEDGPIGNKCFAGSRFEELSVPYQLISSDDNRPVQFQFSQIDRLNLNQAEIHERLQFDKAELGDILCKDTEFTRKISFEESIVLGESINFRDTVFRRDISFDSAELSVEELKFEDCDFEDDADFEAIDLTIGLDGNPSEKISFEDSTVAGEFNLKYATFRPGGESSSDEIYIKVKFNDCAFADDVKMGGAKFGTAEEQEGSAEAGAMGYKDDDVSWSVEFKFSNFTSGITLDEIEIDGELNILNSSFSGNNCNFQYISADEDILINNCVFSEINVRFKNSQVYGDLDLSNTSFGSGVAEFSTTTVAGDVNLKQTSFSGKRISFSGLEAAGSMDFEGAFLKNDGGKFNFSDIKIEGGVNFSQATLSGNEIDFTEAELGRSLDAHPSENIDLFAWEVPALRFEGSTWEGGDVKFSGATMSGGARYNQAKFFGDDLELDGVEVHGDFLFKNCEITSTEIDACGLKQTEGDKFDFSHTRIGSNHALFKNIDINCERGIYFTDTRFECPVEFNQSTLVSSTLDFTQIDAEDANLEFKNIETSDTPINFNNSVISDGEFVIGDFDTIYEMINATVGDVDIEVREDEDGGETMLFEHFVFKNTIFDGFDFSDDSVNKQLKRSGWQIHTTEAGRYKRADANVLERIVESLGKYYRLVTEGPDPDFDPSELEVTYMKAKLGAQRNGDPDAVSHFFQKELGFRRQSYGYQFWERSDDDQGSWESLKSRARNGGNWISNTTLWLTVGYGERPRNVFLTSILTIIVFGFIYRAVGALGPDATFLDYLTYSLQGFIQLVVGIQPASDILVRFWTSVEGFLGAFVIALFVITLTRSIER